MFARELSIVQNHFADNLSGAVMMYGGDVLLLRNHIQGSTSSSTGFALIIKDVEELQAVQNVLVDNRIGMHLDTQSNVAGGPLMATANTIARNSVGVTATSSTAATFSGNSFADNTIQVLPQGSRMDKVVWSDQGRGNYWSTYRGYDADGSGFGTVRHTEGGSVDRLFSRNPELIAIADTPAMQLLRSVEERWGRRTPVVTDAQPLMAPVSPVLAQPASEPAASSLATIVGLLLVLPALTLFVRRPRRLATTFRRSPRAIPA
jgi:nitrous oxidase accessory protein NosD